MLTNWVFDENLRPFLASLGWFVGYDFDPDDWTAVGVGIEATDQEKGSWFDYVFVGRHRACMKLARDPGTSVVHIQIDVADAVVPKVEASMAIFQTYRVRPNP